MNLKNLTDTTLLENTKSLVAKNVAAYPNPTSLTRSRQTPVVFSAQI